MCGDIANIWLYCHTFNHFKEHDKSIAHFTYLVKYTVLLSFLDDIPPCLYLE